MAPAGDPPSQPSAYFDRENGETACTSLCRVFEGAGKEIGRQSMTVTLVFIAFIFTMMVVANWMDPDL